MNEENTDKQLENRVKMGGGASNFRPWLFKKGTSGNPKGRPPGKSMKEFTKDYLSKMTDEERIEFMDGIPKDILWRMSEGQPHQTSEMDLKAKIVLEFAPEFNKQNEIKSASETIPNHPLKVEVQDNKSRKEGREDKAGSGEHSIQSNSGNRQAEHQKESI